MAEVFIAFAYRDLHSDTPVYTVHVANCVSGKKLWIVYADT